MENVKRVIAPSMKCKLVLLMSPWPFLCFVTSVEIGINNIFVLASNFGKFYFMNINYLNAIPLQFRFLYFQMETVKSNFEVTEWNPDNYDLVFQKDINHRLQRRLCLYLSISNVISWYMFDCILWHFVLKFRISS